MSLTSPVQSILTIVDHVTTGLGTATYPVYKDDGSTQCSILVTFTLAKEELCALFGGSQDYDVIVTIEQGKARSEWIGTDTVAQMTPVILTIYVIEKHSATGSSKKIITPELVRWKAKDSLLKLIKANVTSPGGSIHLWKAIADDFEEDDSVRPIFYKCIVETEVHLYR